VRLSVPPSYGRHLRAWGIDPVGEWWALVVWERHMATGWETPTEVLCSAWTSAGHVGQVEHEDYSRLPRVRLDADREWWPPPPGPPGVHHGVLDATTSLDPPAGYLWKTPRYSKRR
jgi:hypothetical protein